jgi:hypothetical protein
MSIYGDRNRKGFSATGNRTPVSRVTGGDTSHYTIAELLYVPLTRGSRFSTVTDLCEPICEPAGERRASGQIRHADKTSGVRSGRVRTSVASCRDLRSTLYVVKFGERDIQTFSYYSYLLLSSALVFPFLRRTCTGTYRASF